jgi:uncharacterized SAM-binding protein YcdF (DUF218 family)
MSDAVYTAPARASFWQKLGPGGLASLLLALGGGLLVLPVIWRLRQVWAAAQGDAEGPGDALLVLGRRMEADRPTAVFEARLRTGFDLWRRGLAPELVVAGGLTGGASRSEAEAGVGWLRDAGVPENALHAEDRSQHTLENLFHVRDMMAARGWTTLLLVSDGLHLARARALAEGLGLRVICVPALDCPPRRGSLGWWNRSLSEAFLLHWYRTGAWYSRTIRSKAQLARIS